MIGVAGVFFTCKYQNAHHEEEATNEDVVRKQQVHGVLRCVPRVDRVEEEKVPSSERAGARESLGAQVSRDDEKI